GSLMIPDEFIARPGHRGGIQADAGVARPQSDELIRLRERLRVQDKRVEGAEEGRVRADPNCDRQNGDERKTRGLEQRARGVSQIGHGGCEARGVPVAATDVTCRKRRDSDGPMNLTGAKTSASETPDSHI